MLSQRLQLDPDLTLETAKKTICHWETVQEQQHLTGQVPGQRGNQSQVLYKGVTVLQHGILSKSVSEMSAESVLDTAFLYSMSSKKGSVWLVNFDCMGEQKTVQKGYWSRSAFDLQGHSEAPGDDSTQHRIIIVPKKAGIIRICVDLRCLKESVL